MLKPKPRSALPFDPVKFVVPKCPDRRVGGGYDYWHVESPDHDAGWCIGRQHALDLIELLRRAPTHGHLSLLASVMVSMIENRANGTVAERGVIFGFASALSKALAIFARAEYRTGDYLRDDLKGWVAREQAANEAALKRAFG